MIMPQMPLMLKKRLESLDAERLKKLDIGTAIQNSIIEVFGHDGLPES